MTPLKNPNEMRFRPDGTFRVLQVSDPQDLVHPRRSMLRMLAAAYDTLDPDLILFTGDSTLGNHLLDVGPMRITDIGRPAFTLRQMRRSLAHILRQADERHIPFAMIYGNHDDMNDVPREEQFALYRAYASCLPMNETDPSVDEDTYNIPLVTADGRTAWNLWLLDSAWNDETGQHWEIKQATVDWYARVTGELKAANGGENVPSLMFLHVPLPAMRGLTVPCEETDPGAIKDGGGFVRLDESKATGTLGEAISPCTDDHGLFDMIRAKNDVRAVVSGHDHRNCFDGEYEGVRFIQSAAASFRCYGSRLRGVRLFTLRQDADAFDTAWYTYDDLCGKSPLARARYLWDADECAKPKYMTLSSLAIAGALGGAAALIKAAKRR
ncbi:MAG: metallophosphoesterase [Clostridia bacterium]|nr:metallophosphoesterase [Clostridia bacterium]